MSGFMWQAPVFLYEDAPRILFSLFPGEEWAEDMQEFYGPRTAWVADKMYSRVTSCGIKEEGMPLPGDPIWTPMEAWHDFKRTIAGLLAGAGQLAWREVPSLHQCPQTGRYWVSARCAWWSFGGKP